MCVNLSRKGRARWWLGAGDAARGGGNVPGGTTVRQVARVHEGADSVVRDCGDRSL